LLTLSIAALSLGVPALEVERVDRDVKLMR
jgi:hypothetical protein